jgi:hypothetical protein
MEYLCKSSLDSYLKRRMLPWSGTLYAIISRHGCKSEKKSGISINISEYDDVRVWMVSENEQAWVEQYT